VIVMRRIVCALCVIACVVATARAADAATKKKKPAATATTTPAKKGAKKATPQPVTPAANDPAPAAAPDAPAPVAKAEGKGKTKSYDFTAMGIEGKVLTPQIMYLLGRIKVELDRSSLEKRSFIPELERSVDEGGI